MSVDTTENSPWASSLDKLAEWDPEGAEPLLRVGASPWNNAMKAMGQWNTAWDPFYELSPLWTEEFLAFGVGLYTGDLFTPKFIELISIAFDASVTHMYAPGTRRHIKGALAAGATPEEIMAVLQLCLSMGLQAVAQGVPILAEELERPST